MQKAFVLGAGLGTRLKSLTEFLPKPLIPVYQKPLITFCFDHLISCGFKELIVNTHHRASVYDRHFPDGTYRDLPVVFRHEPEVLETAGGIANVVDLLDNEAFLVYNGDILTDFPLQRLLDRHRESDNLVTLGLRSKGHAAHIAWNSATGKIIDIRKILGIDQGSYQFACVYACEAEFLKRLTPGKKESVIPKFLELVKEQRLGGVLIDEGHWWDLGDREAYLSAHESLQETEFPDYPLADKDWETDVHPGAHLESGVAISGFSWVGEGAIIESGAVIHNSLIWPGAYVTSRSKLDRCIVRTGQKAEGNLEDTDV